jgi:hypothetical protein
MMVKFNLFSCGKIERVGREAKIFIWKETIKTVNSATKSIPNDIVPQCVNEILFLFRSHIQTPLDI